MEKQYYFETKHMTVGYGGVPLIRNVEIALEQGEILTLIGPNGAGKSTILKSIAGQLIPIEGEAYLEGVSLQKMDGYTRSQKMAVVFTDRLKTELMTCKDVVAAGRYPYTGRLGILSREDWKIVEESMELVRVSSLAEQDFNRISDGQRQRILLARAICQEPQILLLDEPTSYLDVKYKLDFLTTLQELTRSRKLTVIMSLHELDLAQRISDKVMCIKGDCVQRYGTPDDVFTDGYISELFDIEKGSYEENSGMIELEPATGEPQIFVIGGGGNTRNLYHALQRQGIPFVTGILYDNDLDYPTAKALAAEVFITAAFETVAEEILTQAKAAIDRCQRVISTRTQFGAYDSANEQLYEYAMRNGKITAVNFITLKHCK